jgi:hypothetical protein
MRCQGIAKKIYQWLDSELKGKERLEFEEHLRLCSLCQKEVESARTFHEMLRVQHLPVESSPNFETAFWAKLIEQEKQPWLLKVFKDLEFLIPTPSMSQGLAVVLVAFLIGGTGGAFSVMKTLDSPGNLESKRISIEYLSGFSEFKGVPSTSVAATYLKALEERDA